MAAGHFGNSLSWNPHEDAGEIGDLGSYSEKYMTTLLEKGIGGSSGHLIFVDVKWIKLKRAKNRTDGCLTKFGPYAC